MYEVEIWATECSWTVPCMMENWYGRTIILIILCIILYLTICIAGKNHIDDTYTNRLQCISNSLIITDNTNEDIITHTVQDEKKIKAMNNLHNMELRLKRCLPVDKIEDLWSSRNCEDHKNDGIIFTKNNASVEINKSTNSFKWKSLHTIDIMKQKNKNYVANDDKIVEFTNITLNNKNFTVEFGEHESHTETCIIESECTINFEKNELYTPINIDLIKINK